MKNKNTFIKAIKDFKWGYILLALLAISVGLCFIIFNDESLNTAAIAIGIVVIIAAVAYALLALKGKKRGFAFFLKITFSVILLTSGISSIIAKDGAIEAIIASVGLLIIMDGSFKFNTTVLAWRNRAWIWWGLLVLSVILIFCGFITIRYLKAQTENVAILLGAFLMIDALANIFSPFMFGSIEKREENKLRERIIAELQNATLCENAENTDSETEAQNETSPKITEADNGYQE